MKINKKDLFAIGSIALTLCSIFLSNKAQEEDIKRIKEEIKEELIQEREK